jgi:ABC-type phosphate transport system ATPase subunit
LRATHDENQARQDRAYPFRENETITVDNYTCFVGANGAGKSAILCALNTFFRHTQNSLTNVLNLHEEDFYRKHTSESDHGDLRRPTETVTEHTIRLDQEIDDALTTYCQRAKRAKCEVTCESACSGNPSVRMTSPRGITMRGAREAHERKR